MRTNRDASYAVGSAIACGLPVLLALAAFSMVPRFRNPRSQTVVILASSLVLLAVLAFLTVR